MVTKSSHPGPSKGVSNAAVTGCQFTIFLRVKNWHPLEGAGSITFLQEFFVLRFLEISMNQPR